MKQAQAYRAVQVGSVGGVAFVGTTVLAFAGAISALLPIICLLVTILAVLRFSQVTGLRGKR